MVDQKPNTPSADHAAMAPYWKMTAAILGGVRGMRGAGRDYLPKFSAESESAYKDRLSQSRFKNIFGDIVENLAQRPFSTPVQISEGAPSQIASFVEDVDGSGNNLHVFAGGMFYRGIVDAIDWVLVDYVSSAGDGATVAQERSAGVRPVWRTYPAASVLAAYSEQIDGREQFTHIRLAETELVRDGYKETEKQRVRVFERKKLPSGSFGAPTWTLMEKSKDDTGKEVWSEIEGGALTIGEIPIVPFVAGRREGASWRVRPPMRDAAELQIEHYQADNGLKNAKNLTAFPMLAGNGVEPVIGDDGKPVPLMIGPAMVLYTGSNDAGGSPGSWEFVEPGAQSLQFLASDVKDIAMEMRELGRQPLTAQSGNLTVITTAFAAEKGNSAIQSWALNLIDALENALRLTALWMKVDIGSTSVIVDTNFDLGVGDDDSFAHVLEMSRGDAENAPTISRAALIGEAKRRGILSEDHDPESDLAQLIEEMSGGDQGE